MSKVKNLMTRRVITIPTDMPIEQICKILTKNSLSGVPVVSDNNKLIGFVSERDIILMIASGDYCDKTAKDFMCKKLITVDENTDLTKVSKIFSGNPFRHIPVVKKGEVVGIVSRRDVVHSLLVS